MARIVDIELTDFSMRMNDTLEWLWKSEVIRKNISSLKWVFKLLLALSFDLIG